MFVKLWMTSNLLTVTSRQPLVEVEQLMRKNRVRRVLVVDDGKLCGIISSRDLFMAMPPLIDGNADLEQLERTGRIEAGAIMTRDPVTVDPLTPLEEAALLMRTHKFGALPVVREGELVGIITETNIFDALLEMLGAGSEGARIDLQIDRDPEALYALLDVFRQCGAVIVGIGISTDLCENCQLVTVKIKGDEVDRLIEQLWQAGVTISSVPAGKKMAD
ncbi:MAG: CBS domain-containing protein [Desulfobulbus sp.]|jgi:acetoin utilization protein AcuB